MAKKTTKTTINTSFHNSTITASLGDLIKILGKADYVDNTGDEKVNFEWDMETEKGDVFTIYSWKEYIPIEVTDVITWHIGAKNSFVSREAEDEINSMLNESSTFNMTEWITKNKNNKL